MTMKPTLALALVMAAASTPALAARLTEAPLVGPQWLKAHLGAKDMVIVDVRDPAAAYAKGHIPGAVSAPYAAYGWRAQVDGVPGQLPPLKQIAARIGALGVGDDTQVVVVAQGTNSSEFGKATRVYWTFKVLGHDAVTILDGGEDAWKAAGNEVSEEATQPVAARFTARLQHRYIADTAQVAEAIGSGTALVDARPAQQFEGAKKSPVDRVAGTIPSAVNLTQGSFYKGRFAAPGAVEKLAAAVGLKKDQPKITFCNTGHWASIAWFGLSQVDGEKKVALYDGSMAQWTKDPARPVVVAK
jgi:thiosulfate/3-mercaptopyruvate sulfurtransferase